MTDEVSIDGHGHVVLADGRRAFLKLATSTTERVRVRHRFAVEKVSLAALAGLAVPTLYPAEIDDIPALARLRGLSSEQVSFVVESYEGEPFHDHLRTNAPAKMLGAWLFCVEQLVAFRRHQLLYTDVKCANIVARREPWRVVVVDFDRVIPLVGRPNWNNFGDTRGYDPPELATGVRPSEASCVYELAMLLVHFTTGGTNRTLHHPRRGLSRFVAAMRRIAARGVAELVARCLADDPRRRPSDYEAVLEEIGGLAIPAASAACWRELRAPYARRLADIGLDHEGALR